MVGDTLRVPRSEALNGSPKVRGTLQVLRLEALNESPKVGGTLRAPSLEALNRSPKHQDHVPVQLVVGFNDMQTIATNLCKKQKHKIFF